MRDRCELKPNIMKYAMRYYRIYVQFDVTAQNGVKH